MAGQGCNFLKLPAFGAHVMNAELAALLAGYMPWVLPAAKAMSGSCHAALPQAAWY